MIHCTAVAAAAAVGARSFWFLVGSPEERSEAGKELGEVYVAGEEEEQGKANKLLVPLAHTVFLPARHLVISETKVEVGIDLRHF